MSLRPWCRPAVVLGLLAALIQPARAATPPGPLVDLEIRRTVTNVLGILTWSPFPAAEAYSVRFASNLNQPLLVTTNGTVAGPSFTTRATGARGFWDVRVTPMSSNALLTASVLNRLAYGPTPDDLDRVLTGPAPIGPDAYIAEQLAPESIANTVDAYSRVYTNGVSVPAGPRWGTTVVRGRLSAGTIYIYLTGPGQAMLDDIQLLPYTVVTNIATNIVESVTNIVTTFATNYGANLLANGDFESAYRGPWTNTANFAASGITNSPVNSGLGALRVVATAAGSGSGNSIFQNFATNTFLGRPVELRYSFVYATNSSLLTVRLSSGGTGTAGIYSGTPNEPPAPGWIYVSATGRGTESPNLYLYLGNAGRAWIDDIKLVRGTVAEVGPNLVVNGDFESGDLAPWIPTANFSNSLVTAAVSRSGGRSLEMVASRGGSGRDNSLYQVVPGVTNGGTYTLSYWYRPAATGAEFNGRLSGSQLVSTPDGGSAPAYRRRLDDRIGTLSNLRAWFCSQAVASPQQLLEVLSQWCENHFVTQHAKSVDYLDTFYDDFDLIDRLAADWEFREMSRWRQALMSPQVTFLDLLRISAESPAMIVYLDTVDSKGNGNSIANENYARELFELFAMGVDNGYDQTDIVHCSRAWTGWSVELVDAANQNNPHAPPSVTLAPGISSNAKSNTVGVWAFNYKGSSHHTTNKYLFYQWNAAGTVRIGPKTVPARFGAPWAGRPYSLVCTNNSAGTAGINDGYQVLSHVANLPFTMEYIAVKLCRLFVHDNFRHGVYDYTSADRSEEVELVRQCMLAWENATPKGQLRPVLQTIFNSALFRSHGGSLQKIKTPLEFTVSAVRALRASDGSGGFTATTDGGMSTALGRMGSMSLFNRAEPDGYPETGAPWISAGTLAERLRYVQSLLTAAGAAAGRPSDAGNSFANPVALLKRKLPAAQWNDAGAVADFFLRTLYPAEGRANLTEYRAQAVNFLNTADNGTPSLFSAQSNTGTTYDTRVRGMVSMLMTFQRFHEQ